ncbi:MAG: hypothetical protein R6T98_07675 [Desulfatiglandales bacterium]
MGIKAPFGSCSLFLNRKDAPVPSSRATPVEHPEGPWFNGAKRGRHLLTLCPLILSVFLDRIYRINWMFFLFSLSGRKGERESACGGGEL